MTRRRRRPDQRWSTGFTMELFPSGGDRETLDRSLADHALARALPRVEPL